MRLSIRALKYFLAAAERGSIARAAEALNVVPSAVAKAIEQVEAEFELKLVQRYPAKGVTATAAGTALVARVRRLVEEYDNLLLAGTELREALSGEFTLGYYAPTAPAFVPPVVARLVRDNPHLRLRLVECDNERAQDGLLGGAFDLIVFVAANVRTGIGCEPLIEAPPYLLAPAGHPLSRRASVGFADLDGLPLVLLDLPFTSAYYRSLIEEHGVQAPIVARATTTEMVRGLVAAGLGCAILNMRPRTDRAYTGQEVWAVPIRPAGRALTLALGHLGEGQRRLTRAFIGAFREAFSEAEVEALVVR